MSEIIRRNRKSSRWRFAAYNAGREVAVMTQMWQGSNRSDGVKFRRDVSHNAGNEDLHLDVLPPTAVIGQQ